MAFVDFVCYRSTSTLAPQQVSSLMKRKMECNGMKKKVKSALRQFVFYWLLCQRYFPVAFLSRNILARYSYVLYRNIFRSTATGEKLPRRKLIKFKHVCDIGFREDFLPKHRLLTSVFVFTTLSCNGCYPSLQCFRYAAVVQAQHGFPSLHCSREERI